MNKTVYYLVFLGIFIFSGLNTKVYSQEKEKIVGEDKTFSTPFCSAAMGWTLPFGEMQNRYEPFLSIDANLGWKTSKNWLYMAEFGFAFGMDNVKIKDDILRGIMTNDVQPFVISEGGTDAGVVAYNRNISFVGKAGRLFPISKKHPNSGIMIMIGAGWLQHQIIYQATLEKAPQLEGDYAYGYDRQMRGLITSAFVGYMHMSKKNFLNFYLGVEFNQAWTRMTRDYQFDLKSGDNTIYQDRMFSFKFGWMFPFFGRDSDKVYYY